MFEYQIEALPVEAQQRVLALREAKSLLIRRRTIVPGGPFNVPTHTEIEISAVDLVTVASWIVTGNDPWESVPAREQVEIEAQAESLLAPIDDEDDLEPSPTEARIGDYVDRLNAEQRHEAALQEQEAIARESTVVTSQVNGQWSPGGLDPTETIPAVPAEPTFDQVMEGVGPSGVCAGAQHGAGYVAGLPGQAVKHVGCTFNGAPMTESERAAEAEADRRAWS